MFITDGAFVVKSPHVQINAVLCIEPMQSRLCIVFAFTALYYSFFVGFCGISTFSHSFRITRLNYFTRFWIRLSSNLHPFLSIIFVVFANILLPWTNFKMYSPFIFVTVRRFVHHIQIHYSTWKPTGFSIRLYSLTQNSTFTTTRTLFFTCRLLCSFCSCIHFFLFRRHCWVISGVYVFDTKYGCQRIRFKWFSSANTAT